MVKMLFCSLFSLLSVSSFIALSAVKAEWTQVDTNGKWNARAHLTSLVSGDSAYVISGGSSGNDKYNSDVWTTVDGATWNNNQNSTHFWDRTSHASVLSNGVMYVTGGYGNKYFNDVWSSTDNGRSWVEATSAAEWVGRQGHANVAVNGVIFVMGGESGSGKKNDVWSSRDGGVTWTAMPDAPWSGRSCFGSFVYNNIIYVIGSHSDVWSSADGANTWTNLTPYATNVYRVGLTAVEYSGDFYTMGGTDGMDSYNEVWKSADLGVTWEQMPDPEWSPREYHSSAVLNGKLYVMGGGTGGQTSPDTFFDDVWVMSDDA